MRYLAILFLIGCPKHIVLAPTPVGEGACSLTIRVDASCVGYSSSLYEITDSGKNQYQYELKPGDEVTFQITPGLFESRRVSHAGSNVVFDNGLKREKTLTTNDCSENGKFTNQLVCD